MAVRRESTVHAVLGCYEEMGQASFEATRMQIKQIYEDTFQEDADNDLTMSDRMVYKFENLLAVYPRAHYYVLLITTLLAMVILGGAMALGGGDEEPVSFRAGFFMAFQVISTLGFEDSLEESGHQISYVLMIVVGVFSCSILIGMITETFEEFMKCMSEGKSKVPVSNHTLILGWNETTVRVVCQIAFLRRQFQKQNETLVRRLFPWRRATASTPVATSPVVIMDKAKTKREMHEAIREAFEEVGISSKRTRIGRDVVCRVGDPTVCSSLHGMGAHRARSIILMMTNADDAEADEHEGCVQNGATLRTLLALRRVLCLANHVPFQYDMRVIAQLSTAKKAEHLGGLQLGKTADNRQILQLQDFSVFVNSLLFSCTTQPGMAFVLLALLNFEGSALKLRKVVDLPDQGEHIIGKTFKQATLLWENALLAGVFNPSKNEDVKASFLDGLAPSGDRVIKEVDSVIFISRTSSPSLAKGSFHTITKPTDPSFGSIAKAVKVLVCGWRKEWDHPERLAWRIRQLALELPLESEVAFLNTKGFASHGTSFKQAMDAVCSVSPEISANSSEGVWMFKNHIRLYHISGNAAIYKDLDGAIKDKQFDTAVVLSTSAGKRLSPFSQDTRVMTIIVSLHRLQQKYYNAPIHVVAENAMDSTASLAVASDNCGTPDFVNVHAIYASALTQALAYPQMQAHLVHLFASDEGFPSLRFLDAMKWIPQGEWAFGSIINFLHKALPDDIIIGLSRPSGHEIAPCLSKLCKCDPGDRLVVITRRKLEVTQEPVPFEGLPEVELKSTTCQLKEEASKTTPSEPQLSRMTPKVSPLPEALEKRSPISPSKGILE
eukprot:TRINITY_DN63531_c0_g1_i1.p1 TRINITY_DN63531_c0_g1~~TRINITY_DN63531_c0_g1_i1.p1  ORF type:complete len:836 (-),score=97.81 TRINITY_DN63531_c0_g1_i1:143-2650(-)